MSGVTLPKTTKPKRNTWGTGDIKKHIAYFFMLLPGVVFLFTFAYMPLPAIAMAFKNFRIAMPPDGYWIQNTFIYSLFVNSQWVGLSNFSFIFSSSDFALFMRNTLGYNITFMVIGLCFAIAIAVGVNEIKQRFLAKLYHTVLFMPFFLSWIIVTYIVYAFISSNGILNQAFKMLGMETVNIYSKLSFWPFIFIFANIWRYAGNNSIIYLATVTGFDQQLYEAATIDGAGKWKQFWYITFPLLVPTIVLLQILAVGRILSGDLDMFWNLPNGSGILKNAYLTIDVYVLSAMKTAQNLGLPSAAAFFQSAVGFLLVITTNTIVRKIQPDMAMF